MKIKNSLDILIRRILKDDLNDKLIDISNDILGFTIRCLEMNKNVEVKKIIMQLIVLKQSTGSN